jgi:hypothetical protein
VEPDVKVSAADALTTAEKLAIEKIPNEKGQQIAELFEDQVFDDSYC